MDNKEKTKNVQAHTVRRPALDYRIESEYAMDGPLLTSRQVTHVLMGDRSLAVVSAAKSQTVPAGHEIRVVYVPTGEVVFTKAVGKCMALAD